MKQDKLLANCMSHKFLANYCLMFHHRQTWVPHKLKREIIKALTHTHHSKPIPNKYHKSTKPATIASKFFARYSNMVTLVNSSSNLRKLNSGTIDSNVLNSVSRTGSGYMTSSSQSSTAVAEPCISCTTFNILAPIYKRLDQQNQSLRESDNRAFWFKRNQMILDWLLSERSSIICLQEFWVGNEELVKLYEDGLASAGYMHFKLARTNNRGDGLLTAIQSDSFKVINHQDLLFNDFGDRVAQLLHVQSVVPLLQNLKGNIQQESIIVNTHLLFPHDSSLSIVRLHQVYKLLQSVESYLSENKLGPLPIILCGDWNGSKRGQVYKFLRSQGFVSSYDAAHQYHDNDAETQGWVSHRNHRGNICGVDFIWLCNPNKPRKSLNKSWAEAAFGIIKYQLKKASLAEDDAFAFLKADEDGDIITHSAFREALRQVNLTGVPHGLSYQDIEYLWDAIDIDGNGVVDYEEFRQRIWHSTCIEQEEEPEDSKEPRKQSMVEVVGFEVQNAVLFPQEVEKGIWPEHYSLSDHARLTVVLSPVRIMCSPSKI